VQVVMESDVGFVIVDREDVGLPAYEIGQTVIYKKDTIEVESEVMGHSTSVRFKQGEITTDIVYELDNGDTVYENEIDKYYPMEDNNE
jgi:hypothetical protein